ncbi:hypothetical protein BU24DRAFT_451484 [Aaosphaeria arxii CBS 175.79]|uniref:Zn(2)-C6 fungal-type domain-containing protein n=1 Tax=Aaosphaeria arxii CBS 175.79 TaxID=1450172 RepID=A0A6A5XNY7_9PLEO|nr:uncharacterized protein BU24DRAFT_451484 [Aaosphaeria arxii CBS 175.79]KAF2014440.1 hypothetical protein BU24DRAFT_451484 [Aaosphaeria arxii CBS 175.79]
MERSLKRAWENDIGEGTKETKKRSTIACQACRTAKVKCDVNPYAPPCLRCVAASIPCFLPESRRGRVRGSKNRSTFEQILSNGQGTQSMDARRDAPIERQSTDISVSVSEQVMCNLTESTEPASHNNGSGDLESQETGTITPLDPHNLMKSLDEISSRKSKQLTRRLLHLLGEQFPVCESKEVEVSSEGQGSFQDLLPSITKIAKQGWNLDGGSDSRRSKRPAVLSVADLPSEDARLLDLWTPAALQEMVSETTRYFEYGLQGSKRDVARDLDPLQRSMISFDRAHELFTAYFDMVHPQWSMLNPSLHTLQFVRSRSAMLTTTVLALGSIALATLPDHIDEQIAEAKKLYAHAEKLSLVVYSTGARSIEIVQAQILLSRFGMSSRTRLDEQRWLRSAMIPRMAIEIGLIPRSRDRQHNADSEDAEMQRSNALRTRAFLILNEYRFFSFNGSAPIDLDCFNLNGEEIEEITQLTADHHSVSLPALYQLYLFQNELRKRADSYSGQKQLDTLHLEADLAWISSYIQQWIRQYCSQDASPRSRAHLIHDALSCQLLLSARIVGKLSESANLPTHQRRLLDTALAIFRSALDDPVTIHMNTRGSIFPFAGAIILRFGERRDLVLRLALRLAGDPTRPYVPNFVRNAGSQLLAMLCANQPGSKPQSDDPSLNLPENQHEYNEAEYCPNEQVGNHRLDDARTRTANLTKKSESQDRQTQAEEDESGRRQESLSNEAILNCQMQPEMPAQVVHDINWTTSTSYTPANVSLAATENGSNLFIPDYSLDFPYTPISTEYQRPIFSSQDLNSDYEMLVARTIHPHQSHLQQLPDGQQNLVSEQGYQFHYGMGIFSPDSQPPVLPRDPGEMTAGRESSALGGRTEIISPVNSTCTSSMDNSQGHMNRQEYQRTLFSTIEQLLQLASRS